MTARRIVVALIAYAAMAAVAIGAGAWQGRPLPLMHPRPWLDLGAAAHAWSIAAGLALAALTIASTRVLLERAAWARALRAEFRTVLEGARGAQLVALGLASGLAEELFFRGALQPWAGWIPTSIVFGLVHVGPTRTLLPWTVWALAMGVLLGAIFEASGSLAGPVLAHVLVNAINLRAIVHHDARIDHGDGRLRPPRLVGRGPRSPS